MGVSPLISTWLRDSRINCLDATLTPELLRDPRGNLTVSNRFQAGRGRHG